MARAQPIQFKLSDFIGPDPPITQLDFVAADSREVAWIGGIGAGKTVGLCAKAVMVMLNYPGSRVMIARRTYDELIKTTKQTFFRVAEPLKKVGIIERPRNWEYTEQTNYVRLSTGAELHFSNLEDLTKFKNIELTWIGIDQGEENELDLMMFVKSRLRKTFRQKEVPPSARQFCVIANDDGHNWIWKRYHPDSIGYVASRQFFHSTSLDNAHLDPENLKDILAMPPEWVNQYVYARMDAKTGRLLPDPQVIPPCDPPPGVPVYLAVDHGESTVCSAHWAFENTTEQVLPGGIPPGHTVIFREYWLEGGTVEDHARNISAMNRDLKVVSQVMDHTAFNHTQTRRGGIRSSIADLYRDCGLYLAPSVGNPGTRIERINVVQARGLYVTKDCPNYIRQAPQYHTKVNSRSGIPEIVNKSAYHAVDSVGYLLMSMPNLGPRVVAPPGEDELPPWLLPGHEYWQQAKDEASRQFAVANHRERTESLQTAPFGGGGDDEGWRWNDL